METITLVNLFGFAAVTAFCVFKGLDLKKWYSWLFGLYGFFSGFFWGWVWSGMLLGLQGGALLAFAVMYGGATTHLHRQRYKK